MLIICFYRLGFSPVSNNNISDADDITDSFINGKANNRDGKSIRIIITTVAVIQTIILMTLKITFVMIKMR